MGTAGVRILLGHCMDPFFSLASWQLLVSPDLLDFLDSRGSPTETGCSPARHGMGGFWPLRSAQRGRTADLRPYAALLRNCGPGRTECFLRSEHCSTCARPHPAVPSNGAETSIPAHWDLAESGHLSSKPADRLPACRARIRGHLCIHVSIVHGGGEGTQHPVRIPAVPLLCRRLPRPRVLPGRHPLAR